MSLAFCVALFHHRWSVPAMAALFRLGEASRGELAESLRASRQAVGEALEDLCARGLLRECGEGRARRYTITDEGAIVAEACAGLGRKVVELDVREAALRKWSMPVVMEVGRGVTRYNELLSTLPGVTPRALALALKEAVAAGLITRRVEPGYPPTTSYALAAKGELLYPVLAAFGHAVDRLEAELLGRGEGGARAPG